MPAYPTYKENCKDLQSQWRSVAVLDKSYLECMPTHPRHRLSTLVPRRILPASWFDEDEEI